MKALLFIGLFFSVSFAFAQVDTSFLYTDEKLKEVKPELAKFIFKGYQKDSVSWIFLKYDGKKAPLLKETYADPNFEIKHGLSIEYKNGKPYRKGIYINNKKEGNFISYDTLGVTTDIEFYKLDSLSGTSYSFWPNGNKRQEKVYGNKEKIMQTIIFYDNGNIAIKETFSEKGKLIDSSYLDITGNKVKRWAIESPPTFPGGIEKFYAFLARNIRYPKDAMENNIQGNVHVSFIINDKGYLEDIKVERRLHPSIDEEALRVIKLSPKWSPGKILGAPVRIKYNVPIKFSSVYSN